MSLFNHFYFRASLILGLLYSFTAAFLFSQNQELALLVFATEGGLGENIAACAWALAWIGACVQAVGCRYYGRNFANWFCLAIMFFLTTIREFDLHNFLLADAGVMLRTAWMRDPGVPLSLKVTTAVIAFSFLSFIVYLLYSRRSSMIKSLREGEIGPVLFVLGGGVVLLGTLFDGTMLGNRFLHALFSKPGSIMIEEVGETVGALLCCLAVAHYAFTKE